MGPYSAIHPSASQNDVPGSRRISTLARGAIKWRSLVLVGVSTFQSKQKNDELDAAQSRIMAPLHGVYTTKTNSSAAKMGRSRSAAEAETIVNDFLILKCVHL